MSNQHMVGQQNTQMDSQSDFLAKPHLALFGP